MISNGIRAGDPEKVEALDILVTRQKKPFNGKELNEIIQGRELSKVWLVGDRLMTDILLANRMGCSSLLVTPLEPTTISKHGLPVFLLRQL